MGANPNVAIFFLFFFYQNETKGESWPVRVLTFGECTARVKLESTDFSYTETFCKEA